MIMRALIDDPTQTNAGLAGMSPEVLKGLQFEISLELMLLYSGYRNVRRDVAYWREGTYRQVDIDYPLDSAQPNERILVEAKSSSGGAISFKLIDGEEHKQNQQIPVIDNVVNEVYERHLFASGFQSVIMTNRRFQKRCYAEAEKLGVLLVDEKGVRDHYIESRDGFHMGDFSGNKGRLLQKVPYKGNLAPICDLLLHDREALLLSDLTNYLRGLFAMRDVQDFIRAIDPDMHFHHQYTTRIK